MPSPTTEQRIAIICDYNADKIKAIKELIKEEVLAFKHWDFEINTKWRNI